MEYNFLEKQGFIQKPNFFQDHFYEVEKLQKRESKLAEFFANTVSEHRMFIRETWLAAPSDYMFTASESEVLCFVGDCHVHLYKEWFCDNFVIPTAGVLHKDMPYATERVSLEKEFTEFINRMKPKVAKLVQIGDLYEFWEVQAIYEAAFDILYQLMHLRSMKFVPVAFLRQFSGEILSRPGDFNEALAGELSMLAGWEQQFSVSWPSKAPTKMIENGIPWARVDSRFAYAKALAKYFAMPATDSEPWPGNREHSDWDSWHEDWLFNAAKKWGDGSITPRDALALVYFGNQFDRHAGPKINAKPPPVGSATVEQKAEHFRQQCGLIKEVDAPLDFLSEAKIKERIKLQYQIPWDKLDPIQGNHDMEVTNDYLEWKFHSGLPSEEIFSVLSGSERNWEDPLCDLSDKDLSVQCGYEANGGKRICYEHGHAWDMTNNRKNFFRLRLQDYVVKWVHGGFHGCNGWTVSGIAWDGGEFDEPVTILKRWIINPRVDVELERATETRALAMFVHNIKNLRLVIMGHTHGPKIIDFSRKFNASPKAGFPALQNENDLESIREYLTNGAP